MQMNLTTSKKARHRASRKRTGAAKRRQAAPDPLACMDRIHQCCRAVEMLGHLLEGQGDGSLAAEAVREAGGTLVGQVEQLRAALADLGAAL